MPETTDALPSCDEAQLKLIKECPFCGSRLLFVEGVTHYATEAELDENGGIHMVKFADLEQVPYHRTTWLECDANCADSNESSMEDVLFEDEDS